MNIETPLTLQLTDNQVRHINEGQEKGWDAYERALCRVYREHGYKLPDWREARLVKTTLTISLQA